MVTIVVVDDHHLIRADIKALLETEKDFKVVGEAADGLKAVQVVTDLKPDVLVLDLKMPGISGIQVTRQVKALFPQIKVVILSMYSNECYVLAAFNAGACCYVLKESAGRNLATAIRKAIAGETYLSPPLSMESIERYRRLVEHEDDCGNNHPSGTEVVASKAVAQGEK